MIFQIFGRYDRKQHSQTESITYKFESVRHPQEPLTQTHQIDYPILAYKSVSPDNKELTICNLAYDIPQRQIHLNQWEFISFVEGQLWGKELDVRKSIAFLVRDR